MSLPELYSALADPTRLRVLEMLSEKARPVHELAAAFDISRPAISRHLRVLKEARLVGEVKQGRENVYSFERGELKAGAAWLERHLSRPAQKARPKLAAAGKAKRLAGSKPAAKPVASMTRSLPAERVAATLAPQLSFFDL